LKLFYRLYSWLLLVIFGTASIVYGITQIFDHEIIINWSTATEFQTAGFNLYRAESEQGPYQKVNAKIIPASPDPLVGGDYAYRDNQVKPGHVYFYQLEEIEIEGKVIRQETVQVYQPIEHGRPFWDPTQVKPNPWTALLMGIYALVQYTEVYIDQVSHGMTLAELITNVPVLTRSADLSMQVMDRCGEIIPVSATSAITFPSRRFIFAFD